MHATSIREIDHLSPGVRVMRAVRDTVRSGVVALAHSAATVVQQARTTQDRTL
jgi:hypothetical protein